MKAGLEVKGLMQQRSREIWLKTAVVEVGKMRLFEKHFISLPKINKIGIWFEYGKLKEERQMRCTSSFRFLVTVRWISNKLKENVGGEADTVGDSMKNNLIDYICLLWYSCGCLSAGVQYTFGSTLGNLGRIKGLERSIWKLQHFSDNWKIRIDKFFLLRGYM